MATEDELRQTRLNKAERLRELGVLPYPNAWRTNPELEDKRRRLVLLAADEERSEERRVGKECRSRWSPYH